MLKLRPVSLAALCILSSALVFGQAVNGRIDGSIKDAAGAIVPGATLVIQNIATGITRTAQGSNNGAFSFAVLIFAPTVVAPAMPSKTSAPVGILIRPPERPIT